MTTVSTVDPATLRDRTPRPMPCEKCRGEVFWRKPGESDVHCDTCEPCPVAETSSRYWYCAETSDVATFREQFKAERAKRRKAV